MTGSQCGRAFACLLLAGCLALPAGVTRAGAIPAADTDAQDRAIADSLAAMLRAGRAVISDSQARINDPMIGDKGLNGNAVLAGAVAIYRTQTGHDPMPAEPTSRPARLLRAEMDAIVEVMDANQATINAPGAGFKGFIPAVFGRLVSEAFNRRAAGEAVMKVTAPEALVRNRKSHPDAWELGVIKDQFLRPGWPKGQAYAANTAMRGHPAFRIAVPEYYVQSCLACHGGPKGSMDITGYPREGGKEGDLGGVISLVLFH